MSNISVIIPILNEEAIISNLLSFLIDNSSPDRVKEIIVVDGGSSDASEKEVSNFIRAHRATQQLVALSSESKTHGKSSYLKTSELVYPVYTEIRWMVSPKGRPLQMNKGAASASGSILYFLHADTFPPPNFDRYILDAVNQGKQAGCFRMKFNSAHPLLKLSQWFTRFNWKICRGGDQSLFVTKNVFETLEGYNENYHVYEDCEFINRLYDHFGFTVLDKNVLTSPRKYEKNGVFKLQYHFTIIHIKKRLGATPEGLYEYYKKNILA